VVVSDDLANRFGKVITVVPTLAYSSERAERPFYVDLRRPRSNMSEPRVATVSMIIRIRDAARAHVHA
jgi:hypothetical protein